MFRKTTYETLKNPIYSSCDLSKLINNYLYNKYSKKEYSFPYICIDNLMCNDYCHIVSRFKDFLIYDDDSEFLNEFCNKNELKSRLKYIFDFYSIYIHIYPNYLAIPEKIFLYKNLRKKQKVIDENNELKLKNRNNKKYKENNISQQNKSKLNDCIDEKDFIEHSVISNSNNKIINSTDSKNLHIYSKSNSYINRGINLELPNNYNNQLTDRNYVKINLKRHLNKMSIDNNKNTQYSSISCLNYNEESKKSKASLTEIINLLSPSDKSHINKNNILNQNKEKNKSNHVYYKLTKNNKNIIKFFRLGNKDYIKKDFKTNKIESKLINSEIEKISSIKKESRINYKKNYIKKYMKTINSKNDGKSNIFHRQTISCMENISKTLKNNSQNKQRKRKSKISQNKTKYSNKKQNNNYYQSLALKTISNSNKNNKLNEIKNNIRNNIKNIFGIKNNTFKNKKKLIISTNATINLENNNTSKINKLSECLRLNSFYQNFNTSKNILKNNLNFPQLQLMDSIGYSLYAKKTKTKAKKEINSKGLKIESDSILSTQVSINKNYRHNSTCTEHIISQLKNSIIKKNKKNSKNTLSFSKQYNNYLKTKNYDSKENNINSYGIKPFMPYYLKISNSTKHNDKQNEKNLSLRKNKNTFNFFESNDFYNLRINSIKDKKSKNIEHKKNISMNQKKDKNKGHNSNYLLKSFNKKIFHIKNYKIIKNNNNNSITNNKINNFQKIKTDKNFKNYILHDRSENNNFLNKTHKKNNTTNIGKIIDEIRKRIDKTNKMKIKKENQQNNRSLLNRIKNSNNRNFIQYKIPSKTLTKSLKIKIDNKSNNYFTKK